MLAGANDHNKEVVLSVFNNTAPPLTAPAEYRKFIREMQGNFNSLEAEIKEINSIAEGGSLDEIKMKAIFFSAFYGNGFDGNYRSFADCFVNYETRYSDDGKEYKAAVLIKDSATIYANLKSKLGLVLDEDAKINVDEIYYFIRYGEENTNPNNVHNWISQLVAEDNLSPGDGVFFSPFPGINWQEHISSPYGKRGLEFHTGVDIALPQGTPIHAIGSGKVLFVRKLNRSYGYHLAINHGGGVVSLYAHCSKILVEAGQMVDAGDIIAEVGSTGRSTGDHLHLEVIIDGKCVNPVGQIK